MTWSTPTFRRVFLARASFPDQSSGLFFEEMTASSMVKIDLADIIVQDTPHIVNAAGSIIHSAIHNARKDMQFVMDTPGSRYTSASPAAQPPDQLGRCTECRRCARYVVGDMPSQSKHARHRLRRSEKPRSTAMSSRLASVASSEQSLRTRSSRESSRKLVPARLRRRCSVAALMPSWRATASWLDTPSCIDCRILLISSVSAAEFSPSNGRSANSMKVVVS